MRQLLVYRVAAVLTTQGGTRGHEPGARRNDVSSMVCLACRGEVIIDNRQSNKNAEPCGETCASARLGSCVPQGVADTTTTKVSFPEKMETTRDNDPRMNMCWISTEGTDSTCSTNHDTGTAAPPKMHPVPRSRKMPTYYCVPTRIAPDIWQNLFNVISRQTQSIEFHMLSNLPVRLRRT